MLDDRRQRYRERRGDLAHRHCVTPRQAVEDRSPRRIGERPKSAIECTVTIVNHMVKYPRDARLVKLRACASHTIEVRVSRNVCQSLALLPRTRAAKAALRVLSLLARRGVDRSSTSCSARGLVRRGPCSDGLAPTVMFEPVLLRACLASRLSCFAPVLLRASCSACLAPRVLLEAGPHLWPARIFQWAIVGCAWQTSHDRNAKPAAGFSGLSGFLGDGCS